MPDVIFESFGNSSDKNPQPTDVQKAHVVVALAKKAKDPSFDAAAVVEPILTGLGRPMVTNLNQLNGFKKTVRKAVQNNNREVIEILKAGGFPVTGDEPVKQDEVAVPFDQTAGESSDQQS